MTEAALPLREAERLRALYQYHILDTQPEKDLDDLVQLAASICHAPIALISLVDSDRQWFKSKIGLTETQTARIVAFCSHTILGADLMVVSDALTDDRFANNPMVTGDPSIRFYCGGPLMTPEGHAIGALSVIDRVPRELSQDQLEAMRVLSRQVMTHMTLARRHRELLVAVGEQLVVQRALQISEAKFQRLSECTSSGIYIYSGERFLYANPAAIRITGYSLDEFRALSLRDLVHPAFHDALKQRLRAVDEGDDSPTQFEFQIVRKGGQTRWLDFTAASIEFDGQLARIGTAYDITDRKQAEALNGVQRRVLEMVSRNQPLVETMRVLMQSIETLSEGGVCTVLLVEPAAQTLRQGAVSMLPEAVSRAVDGAPIGPQHGSCGTAAYRKAPVVVRDIASDPLWAPWTEARALALTHGLKACTSVPIMDSRNEVLGTFAMYYRAARDPTAFESDLLRASSHLLGIAIESARIGEALRASEAGHHRTLTATKSGTWDWNIATGEVRFDDAWVESLGYRREEVTPHVTFWEQVLHPEDLEAVRAAILEHFAGRIAIYECVNRLRRKDGSYRWNRDRGQVVERDAQGEPLRMVGTDTDITDQVASMEQACRWEQVFQKAHFGLAYGNVADNQLLAVNEAFARERGYTVAELVGRPILSVYAPEVHEEMRARLPEIDRLGHLVYESVHQRKDGTTFPVLMEVTVITDAQGRPASRVAYALDITVRKRAEEAAQLSQERFRLVAEATNDILWDWDVVTNAYWWSPNAREKFGYDPAVEPKIEAWNSRLHPEDKDRVLALVDQTLASAATVYFTEYRFRLADDSYGYFLDRGQIMRDAAGKPVRMIGAMIDVTEARQAYRSLNDAYQRLQRMSRELQTVESNERRRLSRELHDEVGQLLTALKFDLDATRQALDQTSAEAVGRGRERIARALDLTDQLFVRLRRLVHALRPPVLEQLGLAEALHALAAEAQASSGVSCSFTPEGAANGAFLPEALEGSLYRIAQELLTNVVRHAKATEAAIVLSRNPDSIRLTVRDNGSGFELATAAAKGRFGLCGIQERAELLGGRMDIQPGEGRGTCVTIEIPQIPEPAGIPSVPGSTP